MARLVVAGTDVRDICLLRVKRLRSKPSIVTSGLRFVSKRKSLSLCFGNALLDTMVVVFTDISGV